MFMVGARGLAGVSPLDHFNVVYTGDYTVAAAGDITFDFYSDDGFIFSVGNGATRVSGSLSNPPASELTPFEGYPVVGSYNNPTSPVANSVTVHFPAAGSYPYELDYSECCGGQLVITMATHSTGHGVPPSGSLSLTPFTIAAKQTGQSQTMTLAAMDAAGAPVADLPVTLTSATYPAGSFGSQTFAYDAGGNRTSNDATFDAANRLTSDGQYAYAYDADGELVSRTDLATSAQTTYTWNAEHQLVAVHLSDGSTTTYGYDPFGRRVRIAHDGSATSYVYDGNRIRLEYDAAGHLATSCTFGSTDDSVLEMDRGGQCYYYLADGQGGTVAVTDQTGSVVATYAYDAFGNQSSTGSVANPFTFQGREYEGATGLYYFRARYYDPGTGRFISVDPIPGPNQYAFAGNDPVDFGDPSGLSDSAEYGLLLQGVTAEAEAIGLATDLVEVGVPAAATEADLAGLSAAVNYDVAESFVGQISKMVLQRDLLSFRFYPEGLSAIGRWLTTLGTALRIGGFGQPAIEALNLLVSGKPATALAPMVLPAGTTIFFGEVAGGLPGAVQILIQTATEAIPLVVP